MNERIDDERKTKSASSMTITNLCPNGVLNITLCRSLLLAVNVIFNYYCFCCDAVVLIIYSRHNGVVTKNRQPPRATLPSCSCTCDDRSSIPSHKMKCMLYG
uniref:Uncharacterized protein n=1 Tax=Lygus hesperus TaxID=30085 RepID=A0A146LPJ9_LYGHE